jgi:hypothetical protein
MRQQKLVVMGAFLGILLEACATLSKQSPPSIKKRGSSTDVRVADCDGPALSLPPELRSILEPRTGRMDPDDHWADIAERIPGGFAGILYDLNGKPILMLTNPEQAPEVKKALVSDYSFRHFDLTGAQVLQARWSFAQLVDWYNYLWDHTSIVKTKGMVGGDKDEGTNRIYFAVETEAGRQQLTEQLRALGVPCDLVRIGIASKPYPL